MPKLFLCCCRVSFISWWENMSWSCWTCRSCFTSYLYASSGTYWETCHQTPSSPLGNGIVPKWWVKQFLSLAAYSDCVVGGAGMKQISDRISGVQQRFIAGVWKGLKLCAVKKLILCLFLNMWNAWTRLYIYFIFIQFLFYFHFIFCETHRFRKKSVVKK